MLGKTDKNPQLNIDEIPLVHFIDREHELISLSKKINWENVEKEFACFYSLKGAPSIPMRIMVGLILLKQVYCCSDKSAIDHWLENPYWQHFCGEIYFQHKAPLHFSDFSHFRHRIGSEGEKRVMQLGIDVFGQAFAKSNARNDKKHKAGEPKNRVSRIINTFGNYLIRLSS
jgi:transposase, IS5 family